MTIERPETLSTPGDAKVLEILETLQTAVSADTLEKCAEMHLLTCTHALYLLLVCNYIHITTH